ncbi:MAG: ABC transporter ATP-binding protein, partial [Planctomycetes bacterium]|nr:ABC transporter ATP-binding protein [Planctomycetota bacterium]
IRDGRQLCLVGHSGCGKTSFLNVLAGIVRPTTGVVLHGDVSLFELSESQRDRFRADHVGYVFQTFNLLQGLTALENLLIAQGFAGKTGVPARERAESLLARVGLADRRHDRPATLSVGEQQRVAIARAVVNHPRVVLADEPTANLDEKNGDEVIELLKEVSSEEGNILVLVTHETRTRSRFTDVVPMAEMSA